MDLNNKLMQHMVEVATALNLPYNILDLLEDDQLICSDNGVNRPLTDKEKEDVSSFENRPKIGCPVYHVLKNDNTYCYLCVSYMEEDWNEDVREAKRMIPFAYVKEAEESIGELGDIKVKYLANGAMVRIA